MNDDKTYSVIVSQIPHPDSLPLLRRLSEVEPESMHGQPPVIWDSAEGFIIKDPYGNRFIDFTSGVLFANCGHSHPHVIKAIEAQLQKKLIASYIFPTNERVTLIEALLRNVPASLDQALLFSTGAEAIEASIKLAKQFALSNSNDKRYIISFSGNFHGRTLGSQLAGGIESLKSWIEPNNMHFAQIPFPDVDIPETIDFEFFLANLEKLSINPHSIAAVLFETYQGGLVKFAPVDYMKDLREWCTKQDVVLIVDEVQAGFGRTGYWWGFQHYEITPDLIVCGKGMSSSLPISAVIGNKKILNSFKPGAMSTTHSGNPICCAAAKASIEVIENENLVQNCAQVGQHLFESLKILQSKFPILGSINGKGLVYGLSIINKNNAPDMGIAQSFVLEAVRHGVMLFNPVGEHKATVKINPPLNITIGAIDEGVAALEAALTLVT